MHCPFECPALTHSGHGTDSVLPRYSGFSTRRVNSRSFWCLSIHLLPFKNHNTLALRPSLYKICRITVLRKLFYWYNLGLPWSQYSSRHERSYCPVNSLIPQSIWHSVLSAHFTSKFHFDRYSSLLKFLWSTRWCIFFAISLLPNYELIMWIKLHLAQNKIHIWNYNIVIEPAPFCIRYNHAFE